MRIWFDTEFIEDGKTIELLSIGLIREDGAELYLESSDADWSRANDWVKANVLPHLTSQERFTRPEIARRIERFVGRSPEFWAYFADYDWVVLCQLYGTMMDLPVGWPMFCRDLRQNLDGVLLAEIPTRPLVEHHALADARWVRETHLWLERR